MISIKIKKDDGSTVDLHANADGRRLSDSRKLKKLKFGKKKKVEAEAAPEIEASAPVTITELNDKGIKLQLNYGDGKSALSRKD